MDKRGFSIEDFASLRPGGDLGAEKLVLTVEELMHTGDQLPSVFQDTPMGDVIFEISSKRLGVAVLNTDSELVGVVTDGDLRRAIERYDNVLSKRASDVMTKTLKRSRRCPCRICFEDNGGVFNNLAFCCRKRRRKAACRNHPHP